MCRRKVGTEIVHGSFSWDHYAEHLYGCGQALPCFLHCWQKLHTCWTGNELQRYWILYYNYLVNKSSCRKGICKASVTTISLGWILNRVNSVSLFAMFVINNNYVAFLITIALSTNGNTNFVSIFWCMRDLVFSLIRIIIFFLLS